MILRMYELSAADVERLAGWPAQAGPRARDLGTAWPADHLALELAVAPADSQGRNLSQGDRGATVRRLIPWLVRRIQPADPDQRLLVRLDGYFERGGLVEAMAHLPPVRDGGLYAVSGASHALETDPPPPASLALVLDPMQLSALCADPAVRLERSVRLRLWAVPAAQARRAIAAAGGDMETWEEIQLAGAFYLTTATHLQSVFVIGPSDAEELRHLLVGEAST